MSVCIRRSGSYGEGNLKDGARRGKRGQQLTGWGWRYSSEPECWDPQPPLHCTRGKVQNLFEFGSQRFYFLVHVEEGGSILRRFGTP